MIEVALVFDKMGKPIFWPSSRGNSVSATEDSHILWHRIWEARDTLGGIAHTHPWPGPPSASMTDVTTWAAIERALGRRLLWPIVSMDHMRFFQWAPAENSDSYYAPFKWELRHTSQWLENVLEMRRLSQGG